jgi:hypothetical protein
MSNLISKSSQEIDERARSNVSAGESPFGVNVSYPETVTIRMVDASALGDYEFALLVSGFFCNAAVGFMVAAVTVSSNQIFLWIITLLFSIITVIFLIWALRKRGTMNQRAKTVSLVGASVNSAGV